MLFTSFLHEHQIAAKKEETEKEWSLHLEASCTLLYFINKMICSSWGGGSLKGNSK